MKASQVEQLIPVALSEIHENGQAGAYYPEIVRQLLTHDQDYVTRRAAISDFAGRLGLNFRILPQYPLSPRVGVVYGALARLERDGIVESYFQAQPQLDNPHRRRVYRLAQDIAS